MQFFSGNVKISNNLRNPSWQYVTYVIYSNSHGINMRIFTIKLRELASTWLEPETCQALGYQV